MNPFLLLELVANKDKPLTRNRIQYNATTSESNRIVFLCLCAAANISVVSF